MVKLTKQNKAEISRIKDMQTKLYSNMDRFTTQVILTHMCNSPMTVDEVFNIQNKINDKVTKNQVRAFLDDLVESKFAKNIKKDEYEYTKSSHDILDSEGITKDYLFSKSS